LTRLRIHWTDLSGQRPSHWLHGRFWL